MSNILILTDSSGLPRPFPQSDKTKLEETYSYLLKSELSSDTFYQLSLGGVSTLELVSHVAGYLSHWTPDYIIVQSGMNDCRPAPYPKLLEYIINFTFLSRFQKFLYKPSVMQRMIQMRKSRPLVSQKGFKKSVKKLKLIYPDAEILWMEIYTSESGEYEKIRPGVLENIRIYNGILNEMFKDSFISIQHDLNKANGVCRDHIHLNKNGHLSIYRQLIERLRYSN